MNMEIIEKAAKIIANDDPNLRYCAMALMDLDGYPTVSTITVSKSEGIKWLTFCTGLGSSKTKRIEKCGKASVCFNLNGMHNITLVGEIEVVTDAVVKREMWYDGLKEHFAGPDDPGYCVLRFTTKRYNLMVDWQETQGVFE